MPKNIISFSKKKLASKDIYETMRFAFHTNKSNLNNFLSLFNIKVFGVNQVRELVNGTNQAAKMYGYSNEYFLSNFVIDSEELKRNYQEKNIILQ